MAKPSRSSRKNKKAWRRNVDASDLESGLERKAAARIAAATAAAEQAAADAELFFVDRDAASASASASAAAGAASKTSSRRLKGAAALKRPLRCQLVTARPPVAKRVPASLEKPLKKNTKVSGRKKASPPAAAAAAAALVPPTPPRRASASSVALASSKRVAVDEDTGLPLAAPEDIWKPSRYAVGAAKPNGNLVAAAELSAATATAAARRAVSSLGASAASFVASSAAEVVVTTLIAPRRRRASRIAPIPAVEVDAAGCSYNPDAEQHQDAVGAAVAAELAKDARRLAVQRAAPPRLVDAVEGGGGRDELSRLLADTAEAVSSSDDEDEGGEEEEEEKGKGKGVGGGSGARSSPSDDDDGGSDGGEDGEESLEAKRGPQKDPRRKTTAERNRAARAKALRLELAARKAAKLQRADLASLPVLKKRLAAAAEARALSLARRAADKAEREHERPPHLGRRRWTPADVQVLPTDEITGSLLKLRPYAAVSRDRFASLQKRGRIEVRTPAAKKKRAIKLYEPEGRSDRLVEAQEALDKVKRANQVAAAAARG